ncbi:MAG: polysaccharide deacetylase family protein [Firmicutes bacterium]|nr:polysaccharide deacetylase family protein [Bacillota bacterium]
MFGLWLVSGILLAWGVCYPLTDLYVRFISPKSIRKGNSAGKKICLTFDDGPDPAYTPRLLLVLEKAQIPAAFFFVGEKVQKAPDLVKKIAAAGHEVGYHTYFHRNAYLLFIKKSWAAIHQGRVELEKLIGKPLLWFRPPWGALNLFEFWFLRRLGLRIVLWTANAKDWSNRVSPAEILSRLARKVSSNSIIVLHDSGGDPGSPGRMLKALPEVIGYFQGQGFQFVSLGELLENGRESKK